ncbi:uncharacterized protein [Lolium perenne]|uniref:uncharacterized protein n=1 Tax=Lolium perenne TaxID=4522 RepID=UPI0021F5EBB5|nr:uncharacterized protein LOC127339686 [Lolium perenne]
MRVHGYGEECEADGSSTGSEARNVLLSCNYPWYKTPVFEIAHADNVLEAIQEFLRDDSILLCGVSIANDVTKVEYYNIDISGVIDLQQDIGNPTVNLLPFLYDLANAYIGTNLSKKNPEIAAIRLKEWANFPLDFDKIKYAALDACLNFEIARS